MSIPIPPELAESIAAGRYIVAETCWRCVAPAVKIEYHVRSGWLSVCDAHKAGWVSGRP